MSYAPFSLLALALVAASSTAGAATRIAQFQIGVVIVGPETDAQTTTTGDEPTAGATAAPASSDPKRSPAPQPAPR